jgi:hypothetical protein
MFDDLEDLDAGTYRDGYDDDRGGAYDLRRGDGRLVCGHSVGMHPTADDVARCVVRGW